MKKLICLIAVFLLALSVVQAAAYIKFDGVDGESQDQDHVGWSDIISFSQGIHQPGGGATGPTRRRGDVVMDDLTVKKELDKASPKIAESLLLGNILETVEIHVSRTIADVETVYYEYVLYDVMVTSYTVGGSVLRDQRPIDEIYLKYRGVEVEYTEYDPVTGEAKGTVGYSYDPTIS